MIAARTNFKTVVLGDSIMWGQGLYETQKIHTLVANELQQYGLTSNHVFLAHSGAVIGEPDVITDKPPIDGEVPVREPTIFQQIKGALGNNERDPAVNLVMISGGVNDVDITRILNLRDREMDKYIEDAFYRKMKLLLEQAYHCFPNALIIVVGYYQAFSEDSERAILLNVLKGIGFSVPLLPNAVGELVIDVLGSRLTKGLIERCTRFSDYAHECISKAIVDIVGMLPEAKERIYFADPKFKQDNAIGAPNTLLFGVNADLSPQDPSEIADRRAQACITHASRLNIIEQIAGPRASVGHPNPAGAEQYAKVILANIRYAMPTLFATE
ncbi:MAG: hypothetical protein GC179_11995 [Anaerolineaceae bacterium]|nr:hypothetical protein [Anaerolineaceae bacterium]